MKQYMITTDDNPYNPFTHFDQWYAYDERAGYHTTSFVARILHSSDEASEADQIQAMNQAVDEIVEHNVLGIYRRIGPTDIPKPIDVKV